MAKQLKVQAFSINNFSIVMEHEEINDFKYELDEKGNFKSFEFAFRPITGNAIIKAEIVEKEG